MEIRVLKNFLAVAEEGSITAAAHSLHISQSALSRQMSDLEEELKTVLFSRTNRNTELTDEGIRFRERAYRIVELSDQTLDEFAGHTAHLAGIIRICISSASAADLICRSIVILHDRHPEIKFEIISASVEEAMEKLNDDSADFAVLREPYSHDPYHCLKTGRSERLGVIMRRDDAMAECECIRPEQLKEMELFVFRRFIDPGYAKKLNISRRQLRTIGTYTLLPEIFPIIAGSSSKALCVSPSDLPEDLIFCPIKPEITYETVLAWRKHHLLSPQAEAFLQEMKTLLADFN